MIEKIQNMDNKLIQAQILSYLIGNKKVSKILKSTYIKYFTKVFNELPQYYNTYQYEVDLKSFFNGLDETNNIIPNFVTTNNYMDYSVTLTFTIKNKHIVESILNAHNITINDENFKNMKKVLSGKIDNLEFTTLDKFKVIISTEELEGKDISKKCFKEQLSFSLPNSKSGLDIQTYPLVFTHVTTSGSVLCFNIFSEEDITKVKHFTLPKSKISKFLST
jgi:hypothetical protein